MEEQGSFAEHDSLITSAVRRKPVPAGQSMGVQDAEQQATEQQSTEPEKKSSTTRLYYSKLVLLWVTLHIALSLFSWIVICILTTRPVIGLRSYSAYEVEWWDESKKWPFTPYMSVDGQTYHSLFRRNEDLLQIALVVRSVVAVLTLPLTSLVCAKAAVIWMQSQNQRRLSLRQTLTLADRGWTDPVIYLRLLSGDFKRYGTKFLIAAIALNVIGGVLAPLQTYFLTTQTIKTPTQVGVVGELTDLKSLEPWRAEGKGDNNLDPVRLRSAMNSAGFQSPRSRLWTGESLNCSKLSDDLESKTFSGTCDNPNMAFVNMTSLPDPFLAELPSGYNTGVIRQYAPRINSTARRENISESEWPKDCDTLPHSFFAKFGATRENPNEYADWTHWGLEACMPGRQDKSPWRETRDRQDFSEELYLNLSVANEDWDKGPEPRRGLFRIVLDTTAGYFELPNYMNGQQPGPLLAKDPMVACKRPECISQVAPGTENQTSASTESRRASESLVNETTDSSLELEVLSNRGPLLSITLALFGSGSFMAERMARPEAFLMPNISFEELLEIPNRKTCVAEVPFIKLLRPGVGWMSSGGFGYLNPCVRDDAETIDDVQKQLLTFTDTLFWGDPGPDRYTGVHLTNAFTSAAFLANEIWLLSRPNRQWPVGYDLGGDTMVPVMSLQGKIIISTLLGIYLVSILGLAIYSARSRRWTDQLDGFSLLRLGASLSNEIRLVPVYDATKVRELDELPGWVGDATNGEGDVGHLALGAPGRLKGEREFETY